MTAVYAYIGINERGEVRALSMDDPGSERDNAKLVAEWLKMGRRVERLPVKEALAKFRAPSLPSAQ